MPADDASADDAQTARDTPPAAAETADDAPARAFAEARLRDWADEAERIRAEDPDFSLERAQGSRVFTLLLGAGVPLAEAYRAAEAERLQRRAVERAQRALLSDIRARGGRPVEGGASGVPAFGVRGDVSKLSDDEVLATLRRVADRERVSFG